MRHFLRINATSSRVRNLAPLGASQCGSVQRLTYTADLGPISFDDILRVFSLTLALLEVDTFLSAHTIFDFSEESRRAISPLLIEMTFAMNDILSKMINQSDRKGVLYPRSHYDSKSWGDITSP